jgi:hypothetical protein
MAFISIEEAKTRLEDCDVLLRYIVFLQKNGFQIVAKVKLWAKYHYFKNILKKKSNKETNNAVLINHLSSRKINISIKQHQRMQTK